MRPLNVAVLAAGEGKRLRGAQPKVLTPIWGRPSVAWPVSVALELGPERLVVVAGDHREAIASVLPEGRAEVVIQDEPLGTGHAVLAAAPALEGAEGTLLILYGDCPLLPAELLRAVAEAREAEDADVALVTVELDDPTGYGRILRRPDGRVGAIVEEKDATEEQRAVREVNAGIWAVKLPDALEALRQVGRDNAQGEVYLTDLAELTVSAGGVVVAVPWDRPQDVLGFNDQPELAQVRSILRRRIVDRHLAAGVEIVDPDTTYIDAEVTIEPGARILPCTMIEGRVSIATRCEVGPFTHLRDGTVMERGSRVGNFTETKKTVLGEGVKANHLTYLGDARIGAGTNIGAGTITANYDGRHKHPTEIGERVFIGSGTVLVAPTRVEDDGMTGAGAIVKRNTTIGPGEVWVGLPAHRLRSRQTSGGPESRG